VWKPSARTAAGHERRLQRLLSRLRCGTPRRRGIESRFVACNGGISVSFRDRFYIAGLWTALWLSLEFGKRAYERGVRAGRAAVWREMLDMAGYQEGGTIDPYSARTR
jgi:hypothetical protein